MLVRFEVTALGERTRMSAFHLPNGDSLGKIEDAHIRVPVGLFWSAEKAAFGADVPPPDSPSPLRYPSRPTP